MSFRKRILVSQFLLFLVIVILLFPLMGRISNYILQEVYKKRVEDLVDVLKKGSTQNEMIRIIDTDPIFHSEMGVLLDSRGAPIYKLQGTTEMPPIPKRIFEEAVKRGVGFEELVSPIYQKPFYNVAVSFQVRSASYILFITFPSYSLDRVKRVFDLTILVICVVLLFVNGGVIMIIVHRVMSPVQQIIDTVRSYKEGKEEFLPRIVFKEPVQVGEFSKLASTINSLSDQIQKQIDFYTRQKEETEEILESIGEGIIAADPSAKVIFANQAACRMLGVLREQILKQTLDSLESDQSEILKKCHELIVHALQTAEPAGHTWIIREKGTFYYDLMSSPLAHKDGALLVLQDKTSDYRIVELGKDFIANASHELKTPITIIRGFAETLQDLPNLSKEMLHEITEKIVKTCGRLDKLVRSLLTLTDIEQISVKDFTKVDLISMIKNCIEMLLAVHPTTVVQLHTELISAETFIDIPLFELAVMNILENAVKYSSEPASIDIFMTSTQNEYCIKFTDKGIGISENDLPQIFERFYTVDKARSRKKGGAGLGLSIVRTVLEKHRGRVRVSSELGKGSAFTFFLPKKPPLF